METPLSYRALQAEMILSPVLLTMTIINLFFADIGLTQAQIGITQAVFTAVVLPLNIPFGKLADRTNRAFMNAAGNTVATAAFALYAVATNFWMVIASEALLAVGIAASRGTNGALMRGYCERYPQLNLSVERSRVERFTAWSAALGMLLGGLLGSINLRAPFWADVAVFATCVALSLCVHDYSPRLDAQVRLRSLMHHALIANKRLSVRIVALAPIRESTHATTWLMTPVMIASGLPVWSLGAGWVLSTLARAPGAKLASNMRDHAIARRLVMPIGLGCGGMALCSSMHLVFVLVGVVLLGGAAGFSAAIIEPILAEACDASIQTTVSSIADTVRSLLYIPTVILINGVASDHGNRAAYAVNGVLFCCLGLLAVWQVHKHP